MMKTFKKIISMMALSIAMMLAVDGATAYASEEASNSVETVVISAPTNISLSDTESGIKIEYSMVAGATGYYIYRSTSVNGTYSQVANVTSGSTCTFTDTGDTFKSGNTYYYYVKAYCESSVSEASSISSAMYLSPVKISEITNKSGKAKLKWEKVAGATGYYIYRKKEDGSYNIVKTVKSASTTTWSDKQVSKNKKYRYYVVAYSNNSTSANMNTAAIIIPSAPKITSMSVASSKVTVKWKKNSVITGYQIQYASNKAFSHKETVKVKGANKTSKKLTGLKGSKCYVRIRSYKKIGGNIFYSDWSSTKKAKIRSKVTVFAGDSIMSGLYISRYGSMINISGTKHVVAYTSLNVQTFQTNSSAFKGKTGVEKVISYKPTRVYIMLGMNDVCWRPYADYKNTYIKLIKKIQKACPYAEVVILSVSPVTKGELAKVKNFGRIDTCNSYLKKVAKACDCYYYDFGEGFKGSNGCMKSEYSGGDGIHWSGSGYARFAELINAYDKTLD